MNVPSIESGVDTSQQMIRVSGDGVFATLQGEGISAGRPSVFLRTQDCNLHCGAEKIGWRCDADYTWDKKMPEYKTGLRLASPVEIAEEIKDTWRSTFGNDGLTIEPNVVFTGGEPLLQQTKLEKVLRLLPGWHSEVETNGTVIVGGGLHQSQINCSPKLASSGNTQRARRRPEALRSIAAAEDHWFKFVVMSSFDIQEILEVMDIANNGNFERVLLMAQGVKASELADATRWLSGVARTLGCKVTERNHIYWYGNERRT